MSTTPRVIERLREYQRRLQAIGDRFIREHNACYAAPGDNDQLNTISLELVEMFRDNLPTENYAKMIADAFNRGCANPTGKPSLNSVRELGSILTACLTRLTENPDLLIKASHDQLQRSVSASAARPPSAAETSESLPTSRLDQEFPEHVTVRWLIDKMPIKLWLSLVSFVVSAFLIGLTIGARYPWIVTWFTEMFQPGAKG